MASRLNPYISFAEGARAAMERYHEIFGGQLDLVTFGQMGTDDPAVKDKLMHSMLVTDNGFTLMGADTPPGMDAPTGTAITISLSGDDDDLLRRYWEQLTDGGTIQTPLDKQVWGDVFGSCVDRFGVPWIVNIVQPQG